MARDDIGVGGDSSVRWNIDVKQFRAGTDKSEANGDGWHQEGIAETDKSQSFTITIKLPKEDGKNRARFLKTLAGALRKPRGNKIVITVPIEEGNMRKDGKVDQINISWPSPRRRKQS